MNRKVRKADPISISRSEELWAKTIQYIPSGTQTFSKAPFQHVNGVSPKYIIKGKGPIIWDLDENEYIDYMLGLGPVILGHADDKVNEAVYAAIENGISMSLMHPLETELAETLTKIIPCAEIGSIR